MDNYNILDANPIERFPSRSPLEVIPSISFYLKGKSVCDIGCSSGDLLAEILRLGYSTKVIGIELHKHKIPTERTFIVCGDYTVMPIPVCDVYLMWTNDHHYNLIEKLPSGSLIVDLTSSPTENQLNVFQTHAELIKKISYNYDETKIGLDSAYRNSHWSPKGTRNVFVYNKF
jgi:SAM-dependent methyltransferase